MHSFSTYQVPTPDLPATIATYASLLQRMTECSDNLDATCEAIEAWDALRRRLATWQTTTFIRFEQNLQDAEAKANKAALDEMWPSITEAEMPIKRLLLTHPLRAALEERFGSQAFALWALDDAAFAPSIMEDLVRETKLSNAYSELVGAAAVDFDGTPHTLSQLYGKFDLDDREVRERAHRAYWGWYAEHGDAIDTIFDELVEVRDGIAKKLGCRDFVELGYRRMQRVDYTREDVARVREAVVRDVVPLVAAVRKAQAERYGGAPLSFIDEAVLDPLGEPRTRGTTGEKLDAASAMFEGMHPSMGQFFAEMRAHDLLDLDARANKSGGGFCDFLYDERLPFIFANFNGSKADTVVFTHEAGHAYQMWSSAGQPLKDYVLATYESCEIHSMALEFLTWPHMEKFFGEDAERFRRGHLFERIAFLPYGCAVDAFQHWVYENPNATPAERRSQWRALEATYLPWRDYGDLPHLPAGGLWHRQAHVFAVPFYYIDYVLAGICALQFWVRGSEDPEAALTDYVALCERGGSLPFQALARSAGLTSPFDPGCLDGVLTPARQALGL